MEKLGFLDLLKIMLLFVFLVGFTFILWWLMHCVTMRANVDSRYKSLQ